MNTTTASASGTSTERARSPSSPPPFPFSLHGASSSSSPFSSFLSSSSSSSTFRAARRALDRTPTRSFLTHSLHFLHSQPSPFPPVSGPPPPPPPPSRSCASLSSLSCHTESRLSRKGKQEKAKEEGTLKGRGDRGRWCRFFSRRNRGPISLNRSKRHLMTSSIPEVEDPHRSPTNTMGTTAATLFPTFSTARPEELVPPNTPLSPPPPAEHVIKPKRWERPLSQRPKKRRRRDHRDRRETSFLFRSSASSSWSSMWTPVRQAVSGSSFRATGDGGEGRAKKKKKPSPPPQEQQQHYTPAPFSFSSNPFRFFSHPRVSLPLPSPGPHSPPSLSLSSSRSGSARETSLKSLTMVSFFPLSSVTFSTILPSCSPGSTTSAEEKKESENSDTTTTTTAKRNKENIPNETVESPSSPASCGLSLDPPKTHEEELATVEEEKDHHHHHHHETSIQAHLPASQVVERIGVENGKSTSTTETTIARKKIKKEEEKMASTRRLALKKWKPSLRVVWVGVWWLAFGIALLLVWVLAVGPEVSFYATLSSSSETSPLEYFLPLPLLTRNVDERRGGSKGDEVRREGEHRSVATAAGSVGWWFSLPLCFSPPWRTTTCWSSFLFPLSVVGPSVTASSTTTTEEEVLDTVQDALRCYDAFHHVPCCPLYDDEEDEADGSSSPPPSFDESKLHQEKNNSRRKDLKNEKEENGDNESLPTSWLRGWRKWVGHHYGNRITAWWTTSCRFLFRTTSSSSTLPTTNRRKRRMWGRLFVPWKSKTRTKERCIPRCLCRAFRYQHLVLQKLFHEEENGGRGYSETQWCLKQQVWRRIKEKENNTPRRAGEAMQKENAAQEGETKARRRSMESSTPSSPPGIVSTISRGRARGRPRHRHPQEETHPVVEKNQKEMKRNCTVVLPPEDPLSTSLPFPSSFAHSSSLGDASRWLTYTTFRHWAAVQLGWTPPPTTPRDEHEGMWGTPWPKWWKNEKKEEEELMMEGAAPSSVRFTSSSRLPSAPVISTTATISNVPLSSPKLSSLSSAPSAPLLFPGVLQIMQRIWDQFFSFFVAYHTVWTWEEITAWFIAQFRGVKERKASTFFGYTVPHSSVDAYEQHEDDYHFSPHDPRRTIWMTRMNSSANDSIPYVEEEGSLRTGASEEDQRLFLQCFAAYQNI